jgi:hypothetical protein
MNSNVNVDLVSKTQIKEFKQKHFILVLENDYYPLDVTIINKNGQLKTCVYHKPTAEPYYLPYTSDHPHKYHRNIPYSALIRAAHLCSNVHDFNLERLHIEISLLLGQYPPTFISNQFLRFFQVNQHVYQQLINRITQCERKQRINEKSCKISNSITEKII